PGEGVGAGWGGVSAPPAGGVRGARAGGVAPADIAPEDVPADRRDRGPRESDRDRFAGKVVGERHVTGDARIGIHPAGAGGVVAETAPAEPHRRPQAAVPAQTANLRDVL